MKHVTDEEMIRYVDGELGAPERSQVDDHLEACAGCRRELRSLRRTSERLAEDLELAGLPESLRDFKPRRSPPGSGTSRGGVAAAATVLLLVAAAALAAAPGSPFRAWLAESMSDVSVWLGDVSEARPSSSSSGLGVEPHDGVILVAVDEATSGASVRVRLVDGSYAAVWARGARYHTAAGRVDVRGANGDVRVHLPRSATRAELWIEGERTLVREGDSVVALAADADSTAGEFSFDVRR